MMATTATLRALRGWEVAQLERMYGNATEPGQHTFRERSGAEYSPVFEQGRYHCDGPDGPCAAFILKGFCRHTFTAENEDQHDE